MTEEAPQEPGSYTTPVFRRSRTSKFLSDLLTALGDERAAENDAQLSASADTERIALANETHDGLTNIKADSQDVSKPSEHTSFIPNSIIGGI